MKTWSLVVIVVLLHCAAISALFILQGCGTSGASASKEPVAQDVLMPPSTLPGSELPAEPGKKAADAKTYTIKSGDSISRIAHRYNTSQDEIVTLNNLSDPNKIRVGQKILLPGYVDLEKPVSAPVAPKVTAVNSGEVYVVQPMDSISKIARKLNVSEDELVKLNELADRNKIRSGQKLLIPVSSQKASTQDTEAYPWSVTSEDTAPAVAAAPTPSSDSNEKFVPVDIYHTVEPGQDLASIARLFGISVNELAELNKMSPSDNVRVGQRLKIP